MPTVEKRLNDARIKVKRSIKVEMLKQGLSQSYFAKKLGFSKASVSRAISGDGTKTSLEIRQQIYKILGMDGD